MPALATERTLTELDHVRLLNLVRRERSAFARGDIDELLAASAVVPSREVAADVVTMGSRLLLRALDSGRITPIALRYPADADPAQGDVSVLSPLGSSLLGLRAGEVARWSTPGGERAAEIVSIVYQPEAGGDHTA